MDEPPALFEFLVGSCVALLPWYQQTSHSLRHVVQMTLNATLALVGYPFRFRRCLGTPLLYFSLPASPTIRPRWRRGAGIQSFPGGHRYFSSFFFFFFVASSPVFSSTDSWILTEVRLRARKMDVSVSSFDRGSPLLLLFQSVARCWRFSRLIRVRWCFRRKLGVGGLDTFVFSDL